MPSDRLTDLVPGRECGECTVCCIVATIDSPEFKKVQGVACQHCLPGSGCGIYLTRPPVCRIWYCQWRRLAWLDDSWRPDRSQIMLRPTDDEVPPGYASPTGIVFDILGPCDILLAEKVIEAVGNLIDARIATFLSVPGRPGYASGRVFLNPLLDAAVRHRDGDALGKGLVDGFLLSVLHPQEPITF
jgi:hypothetical protein